MKSNEILKPKTEKEILDAIGTLPPNKMLFSYAKFGSLEGVQKALGKGADINHNDDFEGHTALAIASVEGHFHIVNYLLDRNASICNFALIGAFERMDIFTTMLERVNLKECHGLRIALEVADDDNRTEIANLIRERVKRG
jgi:ankyrin repeat protein